MSIITDALKKAEQEHELKAKSTSQEAAVALVEDAEASRETAVLDRPEIHETYVENIIPTGPDKAASNRSVWFLELQFREVLILSGVVFLVVFVLFLLPKWPTIGGNFSLLWRPAQGGSVFQVGPIIKPVPRGMDGRTISLPFQLSGVSASGNNRYAIVNGTIVQKGDSIDGAFVKEILDQEVILETRAGEIKLKISSH